MEGRADLRPVPAQDVGGMWARELADAGRRGGMTSQERAEFLAVFASVRTALEHLAAQSESEIGEVAYLFKSLATRAETVLRQAAAIAGLVDSESAAAVRDQVKSLCAAVGRVLQQRLEAATTVLEALEEEEKLLHQLIDVTERQEAVAVHLQALSVLTNVEVAQLGAAGGDFQLLAQELSAFSKSVSEQTRELAGHTRKSERTIAQTRREMAAELPDLRREMANMERDIEMTLGAIDAGLVHLMEVPGQFQEAAKHTSQQIAGVVSAIQGHDITRQQIEHVGAALALMASRIKAASPGEDLPALDLPVFDLPAIDLPLICAGLSIQSSQLKSIRASADSWTSQVAGSMEAIQRLSASEVAQIGPKCSIRSATCQRGWPTSNSCSRKVRTMDGRFRTRWAVFPACWNW